MHTTKYLIIGAGMTGDMAAKGIREHDPDGSIALIGADPHPPYKRPLLTKGLWQGAPEEKLWREPAEGQNQHFEVIVRDHADGRFVPELDVHLQLSDGDDRVVADTDVPFIWHPFVLHYGIDGRIPGEGDYTAEVTVGAARFARHDQVRGRRYASAVTARVGPVRLTPGVKARGPE